MGYYKDSILIVEHKKCSDLLPTYVQNIFNKFSSGIFWSK